LLAKTEPVGIYSKSYDPVFTAIDIRHHLRHARIERIKSFQAKKYFMVHNVWLCLSLSLYVYTRSKA